MPDIYVDADACPVKGEVCRVADRYGFLVLFVANGWMRLPAANRAEFVRVGNEPDAADDYIAEAVVPDDIVITADIPLAARCVKAGARVVAPNGREFTDANIGAVLATRNLMTELRDTGTVTGGPAPFCNRDRSEFLQSLDRVIRAIQRGSRPARTV